ncbi:MAG TPA: RNA polymerase sigma-70 factor [Puia sp.]|nr:RNA polymerase sigma-70 factor [Puia sp.]
MSRAIKPYETYCDEELLASICSSDETAFSVLYNRYWDKIFYIAAGRLNDQALAEDIVQDVFTDIWRRRDNLDVKGNVGAYLAVAVKYRVINMQARIQRAERYKKDMLTGENNDSQDLAGELGFRELQQELEKHITLLPEKAKLAFTLSRESGLAHKEIARVMNISEKAVERNIARAIQSIRSAVKNFTHLFF